MGKYSIGEKVRLVSGGPIMTVEGYRKNTHDMLSRMGPFGSNVPIRDTDDVKCVWFEGNKSFRDDFNENTLERVEQEEGNEG